MRVPRRVVYPCLPGNAAAHACCSIAPGRRTHPPPSPANERTRRLGLGLIPRWRKKKKTPTPGFGPKVNKTSEIREVREEATGRLDFYLHLLQCPWWKSLHDATYQNDGPQQESTEDAGVGPLIEEEDSSSLRERRHSHLSRSDHGITKTGYTNNNNLRCVPVFVLG